MNPYGKEYGGMSSNTSITNKVKAAPIGAAFVYVSNITILQSCLIMLNDGIKCILIGCINGQ
jgi:hypothetical protein